MTRHPTFLLVLLAGLFGFADAASAAIISINQAALTSVSQIDNTGTYISGTNLFGANTSVTVNGVQFKATLSGSYFEGPANTPGTFRYVNGSSATSGIFPGSSLDTNLVTLLSSTLFSPNVADMAVVGLDATKTYRLQFVSGENRGTVGSVESQDYILRSGTFTPNGGIGTYTAGATVGSFTLNLVNKTADAAKIVTVLFTGYTALDLKAAGGGTQAYISGLALHQVTLVPAPAALPAGLGLLSIMTMRRRRA
ncbi:MAG: hypothetical protein GC162_03045 [Planctomycetes bacterium]|nr:hypothetical protein [Planctomycetota bacterium]